MPRPKKISPEELISIVQDYYETEASGDSRKLKATLLAAFARRRGYDLKEYDFRRSKEVAELIDNIKEQENEQYESVSIAYKTLDVESIIQRCGNMRELKEALVKMDGYWRSIYVSAQKIQERCDKLDSELTLYKEEVAKLQNGNKELSEVKAKLRTDNVKLIHENKYLRAVIRKNLYPACVDEILKDENIQIKESNTAVMPERIKMMVEGEMPHTFNDDHTDSLVGVSESDKLIRLLRARVDNNE